MKVLVVYSSGYGATKEVADEISRILSAEKTIEVTSLSLTYGIDLSVYEAVVIGTSVRAGHVLAITRDFIAEHHFELREKKVALFVVSLTGHCQEGREKVTREYIAPLQQRYPNIQFSPVAAFGGKIDFQRLNPVMKRLAIKVMQEKGLSGETGLDYRDWGIIRNWATNLQNELSN